MGLATAERFAREGFQVVLSARNEGKVRDLAEQLRAKGHKVEVRTVDAGDPASVAKLVEGVERDFGGIDVLNFNAASMRNQTLANQPRDSFNTDLAVNIGGAAVAAQAAAPKMLQRGSGSVLFTGGGFELQPHPETFHSASARPASALAQGIFEPFKANGVHVATVTVVGFVTTAEDANALAEHFWQLHSQPKGSWEVEAMYTPKG